MIALIAYWQSIALFLKHYPPSLVWCGVAGEAELRACTMHVRLWAVSVECVGWGGQSARGGGDGGTQVDAEGARRRHGHSIRHQQLLARAPHLVPGSFSFPFHFFSFHSFNFISFLS